MYLKYSSLLNRIEQIAETNERPAGLRPAGRFYMKMSRLKPVYALSFQPVHSSFFFCS